MSCLFCRPLFTKCWQPGSVSRRFFSLQTAAQFHVSVLRVIRRVIALPEYECYCIWFSELHNRNESWLGGCRTWLVANYIVRKSLSRLRSRMTNVDCYAAVLIGRNTVLACPSVPCVRLSGKQIGDRKTKIGLNVPFGVPTFSSKTSKPEENGLRKHVGLS